MNEISAEILNQCAREPIHIPGAIQPFGALVICDPQHMIINQISANCESFFEMNAQDLLGKPFDKVFTQSRAQFTEAITCFNWGRFQITTYEYQGLRFFEFENAPKSDAGVWAQKTRAAMNRIQSGKNTQEVLDFAAEEIQRLMGYDRVMIYKFHADDHGEVVAEACNEGVESYMGLHYPASDIPAQARAIFLNNWVRVIPQVPYKPVPLTPVLNPKTAQTPDLGRTLLRSVSPVHLEYLQNMKVGATLSVSLLSAGKLWGLIACHHLTPKNLDENERGFCETIGRFVSSVLRDVARVEEFNQRERLSNIHRQLVSRIDDADDIAKELSLHSPNLLDLIASEGSAAALYLDSKWVTVGRVPGQDELDQIVDWLAENHADVPIYSTHTFTKEFAPSRNYKEVGSGMLAISVPKTKRNYILLFRPELIQTVRWAGRPSVKEVTPDGKVHPRRSFAEWQESFAEQSKPWMPWEIDAALELRAAILSLDLRRQFRKEQEARQEAERAMRSREELMAVLSHDLKNPIGSIQLQARIMERGFTKSGDPKNVDAIQRIIRAAQNMNSLISDILHVTSLEAGTLAIDKQKEDLQSILNEVNDLLGSLAAHKNITLTVREERACLVPVDRERIIQVVSNLLGNAIKFTPEGGSIEIGIDDCHPDFARFSISDTGPGIPTENHTHIFDRFWQANQAKRLGTGLGLAICKGIVEAHGGSIWVENRPNGGTIFIVQLPMA